MLETKQLLVPSDFHILYVNLGLGDMSKNLYKFILPDFQYTCIRIQYMFFICVCVFCGECGCICMISICVADISCDYSDWMRAITMDADRLL